MDTIDQVAMMRGEAEEDGSAPAVAVEGIHKSFGVKRF